MVRSIGKGDLGCACDLRSMNEAFENCCKQFIKSGNYCIAIELIKPSISRNMSKIAKST